MSAIRNGLNGLNLESNISSNSTTTFQAMSYTGMSVTDFSSSFIKPVDSSDSVESGVSFSSGCGGCGRCASCKDSVDQDSVVAFAGKSSSSSDIVAPPIMRMMNNNNFFRPTVTVLDTNVQLGQSFRIIDRLIVQDVDPNSVVTQYRFRETNTSPQSGFFSVDGDIKPAGVTFSVAANLVHTVRYHSGFILGGEIINVQAYDGKFWSALATGSAFTVEPNVDPPVASGDSFTVPTVNFVSLVNQIQIEDPNGYPILDISVVDRGRFGGNLFFNGNPLAAGVWFTFPAAQLSQLVYQGAEYGFAENISFAGRDEAAWSNVHSITATTAPNTAAPVVTAGVVPVVRGGDIPLSEMFSFSDADGARLVYVDINDQGVENFTGYFTVNGVKQNPGQYFRVYAENLANVRYVGGSIISTEEFLVKASDGQFESAAVIGEAATVDLPVIEVPDTLVMLDTFERVRVENLIGVTTGVSALFYEIIDLNPAFSSAALLVNGSIREAGEIIRVTANEFQSTFIQGGADDFGRSLDEFMIRVDNGFATSAWAGLNISTDPVNEGAVLDIGRWVFPTEPLTLTFNFPLSVPGYYCALARPECDDNTPITNTDMRRGIRTSHDIFEDYFNVRFQEVPSNQQADITYMLSDNNTDAGAYAFAPGTVGVYGINGDIWGTTSEAGLANNEPGDYGFHTWQHELGHALGLDHSFEGNDMLPASIENTRYSIMSYNNIFGAQYPGTPMLYDVMALQTHYGANPTYRLGNTHIKPSKTSSVPEVIYDAGGIDTLNVSFHSNSAILNLGQGQFSSIGGGDRNFAIAWGTDIENARGGSGNDTVIGNELDNLLFGYAGNDRLVGRNGNDTLRGMEGNDIYEFHIGDGTDTIQEMFGAGRDAIEVHLFDEYIDDPDDELAGTTFSDVFEFRRNNFDLEIRLTLDSIATDGRINISQMGLGRNRIETLRMFDVNGEQVGPDVDLLSAYQFSTATFQEMQLTTNTSFYGNLVTT